MNLGLIEDHLLRALRLRLGSSIQWQAGPAFCGPATGVYAQVFVHVAAFADAGGTTVEGARTARQAVTLAGGATGFTEQRPGHLDIEVSCLCAQHPQAQVLAGLVAPVLLEALEMLAPPLLTDPADSTRRLRWADHQSHVHSQRSERLLHEGVPVAQVVLGLRMQGFVHVLLARPGGLAKQSTYAQALRLEVDADPAGTDLQSEHVRLINDGDNPVALGGWMLHDAARRPHVYTFAPTVRLAAGAMLRLWSGRGSDDIGNVYWGRRRAVWNNTGDVAVLRDPDGDERARAGWQPPLPVVPAAAPRRPRKLTPKGTPPPVPPAARKAARKM